MSQVFGYEVGSWIVPFHLVPISLSVDCVHVSVLGDMQDAFRRSLQQEKKLTGSDFFCKHVFCGTER